jgi:cysteine-rich repeat protein
MGQILHLRGVVYLAGSLCAVVLSTSCQAPGQPDVHSEALVRAGAAAPVIKDHRHHSCKQRCGNGLVEEGEACDDGNLENGDGCDDHCQLDDNLSTPGDERAHYVLCNDPNTGATASCGPGLGCCRQTGTCASSAAACSVQIAFFDVCDGPEDCLETGQPCWPGRLGRICDPGMHGINNVCHTSSDCPTDVPVCVEGSCQFTGPGGCQTNLDCPPAVPVCQDGQCRFAASGG